MSDSIFSDAEIMANRRLVIDYLKKPKLRKAVGVLKNAVGGRCCLGHMCDALGMIPSKNDHAEWLYQSQKFSLPTSIREKLGMFTTDGSFRTDGDKLQVYFKDDRYGSHSCLANLNDESKAKPSDIGAILETMIEGGDGTPWRKIEVVE